MKALMIHSENSAVGLYRIWRPAKYLERLGWDIARIPDKSTRIPTNRGYDGPDLELQKSAREVGSWEELGEGADIIVMQRPDTPEALVLGLAMRDQFNCPLVFEVDDNIYDVAESSSQYKYWYPDSPLFEIAELLMFQADAITVSTPELVNVYKHLNPNIYVLPNAQDPELWTGTPTHDPDKVVIGWQGSSTHYDDLYSIRKPLKKLLRNYPNVTLRTFGMRVDFLADNPQVEQISSSFIPPNEWPAHSASLGFDIGIAPVVDRPFNRAKSNIKFQEYSMLGIPTVASKVGEYCEIETGVTGYTADSDVAWYAHLERLVKDAELRKRIGEQAKRYTLEHNNIAVTINKWQDAYKRIIQDYQNKHGQSSTLLDATGRYANPAHSGPS